MNFFRVLSTMMFDETSRRSAAARMTARHAAVRERLLPNAESGKRGGFYQGSTESRPIG
jgi:hypothetical protein